MEEKLRDEKEKQEVEDEEMEGLSPVSKTNKLRALIEKYGPEGNKLRRVEEPARISKQEPKSSRLTMSEQWQR